MSGQHEAAHQLGELGPNQALPEAALGAAGFRDPARFNGLLARLRAQAELTGPLEKHFGTLLSALADSCDPDQAFIGFARWLEAGGATAEFAGWDCWGEAPLRVLAALFAGTPALSQYLLRIPARTGPVLRPVLDRAVAGGPAWEQQLRAALAAAATPAQQLAAFRRCRLEALLQVASLDLLGEAPLEDTLRALSDLADGCLQVALDLAVERLRPAYGRARPRVEQPAGAGRPAPPPCVVFALGKLGGRELNYSSDIDLVFIYFGQGAAQGGARSFEYSEYFARLAEELIGLLSRASEEGGAYRVDMRLRPYGESGPLVCSAEETLAYLQGEGRTWERLAWLKARPAAGDLDFGHAFLLEATPFVYRRYLSLEAIGDIQGLKRQTELEVARRGEEDGEVKLGRGGIRDIEFTVQFLQLMHGGQHPDVRGGHTLRALRSLQRRGLLTQSESESLEQAYRFWRHLEHRLQLHGDLQTHKLSASPVARRRTARSMGFADLAAGEAPPVAPAPGVAAPTLAPPPRPVTAETWFEAERSSHAQRVRAIFERLFARLFPERSGPEGELSELLLVPESDAPALARLLPSFGLADTPDNARELAALAQDKGLLTNPSRTRRFFASLAPRLLKALAATGDAEAALKRFSRIAGSLGGKATFYQSLHENDWLLKMTAELAAWSEYLTDILVANPGLFDEVVDALRTGQAKTCSEMEADLAQLAVGGEVGDTLRAYRAGELLRLGVRDLFHGVPLEQTQGELSDLATAVLRAQLAHTRKALVARRGEVRAPDGTPVGFAVLAVGKFGGRELNYGSDLDVLFFYDQEGTTPEGFPAGPYFTELAQELSRAMGTPSALGSLYTLDARLRPNGSKGPLASALAAFERYWKEGGLADWERLALTRARLVAGDAGVGERAEHLVRSAVYSPLRSRSLAEEVRSMRRRLEETAEPGNLKRGRGGIVDIEFLAQYLQLLHGPAYPPLRQTSTRAALQALVRFRKLSDEDGRALSEAFEFLSRMASRVRILHGLSANALPARPEELRKLALRAGYSDAPGRSAGEGLLDDYRTHSRAARALFERVVC